MNLLYLEHHLGIISHVIIHRLFIFLDPTFHTIARTGRSANAAPLSMNVSYSQVCVSAVTSAHCSL